MAPGLSKLEIIPFRVAAYDMKVKFNSSSLIKILYLVIYK